MTQKMHFKRRFILILVIILTLPLLGILMCVNGAKADTPFVVTSAQGVVDTIASNKQMFSDTTSYQFNTPPQNLYGANYVKAPKSGDTYTVQGKGWVYVLTTNNDFIKNSITEVVSQKETLLFDGYEEEDYNFELNFCSDHKSDTRASYAPFKIFSKYYNDGATFNINDFGVVMFSKEKIDFSNAMVPVDNGDTISVADVGEKIWQDKAHVFSSNIPNALLGQKYIFSNSNSNKAKSVRSGYSYILSSLSSISGYDKVNLPSFELYSGSANYNIFYTNITASVNINNGTDIVQFFSTDFIEFSVAETIEKNQQNLAVVEVVANGEVDVFTQNAKIFLDRNTVISSVPKNLEHLYFARGYIDANVATKNMEAKVTKGGMIYAIANANGDTNLMSQGFSKMYSKPLRLMWADGETYYLYSKLANDNETVIINSKWAILLFSNRPSTDISIMAELSGTRYNKRGESLPMSKLEIQYSARPFASEHMFFRDDFPQWFYGKSFLQSDSTYNSEDGINDRTLKVTKAGTVYLLIDAGTSTIPTGFTKVNFPKFKLTYSTVLSNMYLYAKECTLNEEIIITKNIVPIFDTIASYDTIPAMMSATITNLADPVNASIVDNYNVQDRNFQGCPTAEVTAGGRYFYGIFTGGDMEPHYDNYSIVMLGDETGRFLDMDPLLVIDHSIDGEFGVRVEDIQLWLQPETNYLWLFWTNSGVSDNRSDYWATFDHSLGVWASVIKNPDAPLDELVWTAPKRIADGLMRNKPTVLSDGRVLLSAYDCIDNLHANVYSVDDVDAWIDEATPRAWDVYGSVYTGYTAENKPLNSMFDEHQIVELSNGTLWMLMRSDYGTSQSYSYDGGKHWTQAQLVPHLKGGNSRHYFGRTATGEILFVSNMQPSGVGRAYLSAVILNEDGSIKYGPLLLDERTYVTYPDVMFVGEEIWVVYDRGRSSDMEMLLAVFTVKDIQEQVFNSPTSVSKHILSKSYKQSPLVTSVDSTGIINQDTKIVIDLNGRDFKSLEYFDGVSYQQINDPESKYYYDNGIILTKEYLSEIGKGNHLLKAIVSRYDGTLESVELKLNVLALSEEDFNATMTDVDKTKFIYQTSLNPENVFSIVEDDGKNTLLINNTSSGWTHDSIAIKDNLYADVVVETTLKNVAGSKGGFPLIFLRKTDASKTHEQPGGGIAFGFEKSGKVHVYESNTSSVSTSIVLPVGLYTYGEYNNIKIIAEGNLFAIYVNGTYVTTYASTSTKVQSFGYIGIASSNAVINVSSFKVSQFNNKTLKVSDTTLYYDFKDEAQLNDFDSYIKDGSNASIIKGDNVKDYWNIDTTSGIIYSKNSDYSKGQDSFITSLILKDLHLANFELSVDYLRDSSNSNSNWLTLVGRQRVAGYKGGDSGFTAFTQKEGKATFSTPTSGGYKELVVSSYNDTAWHNLRVICVGLEYRIYIDNVLYLEYQGTDNNALAGFLGLQARNNSGKYTNLKVTALDYDGNPIAIGQNNSRIKVAAIGDSITYGLKVTNDSGTLDVGQNYTSQLGRLLDDNFDVRNYGISGRRVGSGVDSYMAEEEYSSALRYAPEYLFIMLGTNDAKNVYWNNGDLAEYKANYLSMISDFRAVNPSIKIYIMTSPVLYLDETSHIPPSHLTDFIVPLQRQIAIESGCTLIDIYSATVDKAELFPDKIHPTAEGCRIIATKALEALYSDFVDKVELSENIKNVKVKDEFSLIATMTSSVFDLSNVSAFWSSDNESVATVDSNGNVKILSAGTANITAIYGKESAICEITSTKYLLDIVPTIFDATYVYGDKMPAISSNSQFGLVEFDSNQDLKAGTHLYNWIFTPYDINYYAVVTGTIEIVVEKATPIFTPPTVLKITEKDGLKLSDIQLPSGFSWKDSSILVTESGEYTAIYKKDDSGNYKEVELKIFVLVEKAEVTPPVDKVILEIVPTIFDGTYVYGDKMPAISSNSQFGLVEFDSNQDLKAGTHLYNWTFTPYDTNYYAVVTGTIEIVVEKATPTFTPPTVLKITEKDGLKLSDIQLPSGFSWKDSSILVTESGEYTAIYKKDDSGNYKEVELKIFVFVEVTESNNSSGCGSVIASNTTSYLIIAVLSVSLLSVVILLIKKKKNI